MDDFIRNIRTWMEMLTAGQAQGLCLAGTSMIQDILYEEISDEKQMDESAFERSGNSDAMYSNAGYGIGGDTDEGAG